MVAKLLAALRSKKGFFGSVVLFGYLVYGAVAVLGNAALVADNLDGALRFLATGPGVLVAVSVAVLLILWALVTQSPETETPPRAAPASDPTTVQENERLKGQLRAVAKERDEYRAKLSDPEAMRELEDRRLRKRCLELAVELQRFEQANRRTQFNFVDPNETVARFVQRHKWKVDKLRDDLDEQAWLTPQERDTLTFSADDYSHKIGDMADTLKSIGMNH